MASLIASNDVYPDMHSVTHMNTNILSLSIRIINKKLDLSTKFCFQMLAIIYITLGYLRLTLPYENFNKKKSSVKRALYRKKLQKLPDYFQFLDVS